MTKLTRSPFDSLARSFIGFDDLFSSLDALMGKDANEWLFNLPTVKYPPYNIKKIGDDKYVIEMAVAGFGRNDIEIELKGSELVISGKVNSDVEENGSYLVKGIAERSFRQQFTLNDTVKLKNADMVNGMLRIWLDRMIPEAQKPKKIEINDGPQLLTEAK